VLILPSHFFSFSLSLYFWHLLMNTNSRGGKGGKESFEARLLRSFVFDNSVRYFFLMPSPP